MKRSNVFVIISGLISLTVNVLAILSYFSEEGVFADWHIDPGMWAAIIFVLMAYSLITWSVLSWRWTQGRAQGGKRKVRRSAAFLLTALAAFPLLTVWLSVLFSLVIFTEASPPQRWLLAMGCAWGVTPFVSMGLVIIGEILGPLASHEKT
jgi:ABC-type amino acid transport system permease subunit